MRATRGFWRMGASFRERRKGSQPELNRLLSMAARCRPSTDPRSALWFRLLRNQQRQAFAVSFGFDQFSMDSEGGHIDFRGGE